MEEYDGNYRDVYFDYNNVSLNFPWLLNDVSVSVPEMMLIINLKQAMPYVLLIMASLSIIGNIIVLLVVLQEKNRKFSTPIYIASLAASNLITSLSNEVPDWLISMGYLKADRYPVLHCNIVAFMKALGNYVSVWSLSVVATERAISVLFPHKVKLICTSKASRKIVFSLWTVWSMFSIIEMIDATFREVDVLGKVYTICLYSEKFATFFAGEGYSIINYTVSFVIPFLLILSSTLVILAVLFSKSGDIKSRKSRVTSVSLTLLQVNIIFLITSGPFGFMRILQSNPDFLDQVSLDIESLRKHVRVALLNDIFSLLKSCNTFLSVFVYFLLNPKFRKDFIKLFKRPKATSAPG